MVGTFDIQNENTLSGSSLRNEAANYLSAICGNGRTEVLVAGKKVDGLFDKDDLGTRETWVLEAKDYRGPLGREDVRSIWSDYEPVLAEVAPAKLILITRMGLAPAAQVYLDSRPLMRHLTIWELEDQVLGLRPYMQVLAGLFDEEGLSSFYVDARARQVEYSGSMSESESEPIDLMATVDRWLIEEGASPVAILGGYGAGKSSFARRLVSKLAAKSLVDPSARRPVLLRLGGLTRQSSLDGLLGSMMTSTHSVRGYNYNRFLEFNRKGRLVIVLDGFDEMKHAMTFSEFRAQIAEFNELAAGKSKIVLLGRPSAFTTDAEHHHVLKGKVKSADGWRRLPGWPDYREFRLSDFDGEERAKFIVGFLAYQASQLPGGQLPDDNWVSRRGSEVKTLADADAEVFGRPVHLKILAELAADPNQDLTRLKRSPSRWSLYDEFFQALARREAEKPARSQIEDHARLRFLQELAFWLWTEMSAQTSFTAEKIPTRVMDELPDGDTDDVEQKRREYLAGAFLERKAGDIYYFPHRSFAEFLVAARMLAKPPSASEHSLYGDLATEGVAEFLATPDNAVRLRGWAETFASAQGPIRPSYVRLLSSACGGPNGLIAEIAQTYWTLPIRLIGGSLKVDPAKPEPLREALMTARLPELCLSLQLLDPEIAPEASAPQDNRTMSALVAGVLLERTLGLVSDPRSDRLTIEGEEGERMREVAIAGIPEMGSGRNGRSATFDWPRLLSTCARVSEAHGIGLKLDRPSTISPIVTMALPLDNVLQTMPPNSRSVVQSFLYRLNDLKQIVVVQKRHAPGFRSARRGPNQGGNR